MTAPKYSDLRQALYTRLTTALGVPVWSPKAPQSDDGELLGPFPYIVIPQANESPWNTKGSRGVSALVQVDGYARGTASDSVEDIIGDLASRTRETLEWYPLTVANAHWVDTQFEGMSMGWEDNGRTRRFVSLFRVTLDEQA